MNVVSTNVPENLGFIFIMILINFCRYPMPSQKILEFIIVLFKMEMDSQEGAGKLLSHVCIRQHSAIHAD